LERETGIEPVTPKFSVTLDPGKIKPRRLLHGKAA
jgi:hypothetical protein